MSISKPLTARMQAASRSDRIFVMENGKIAERGTHQELVNQGGAYKKLWDEYQKAANWKIGGGNEALV